MQLIQFLDAHKDSMAILVALVATIVGPFVSIRIAKQQTASAVDIAKKQIEATLETARQQADVAMRVARLDFNASIVSANRQKWIDNLREAIAELVALLISISVDFDTKPKDDDEKVMVRVQRMLVLSQKIELFLNPNEADHKAFVDVMRRLRDEAITEEGDQDKAKNKSEKVQSLVADLMKRAKSILKNEWERVKTGELDQAKHEAK